MMKKLRKANRAMFGGAMAMNTLPLMKPGANATTGLNALEGGIGIGVAGIVSDQMFELMERKRRRRR